MKTILRFIKPYKWLCFFTLLVMFSDVAGGLLIPTITADMINASTNSENMDHPIRSGILMLIVTIVTSLGVLLGSYLAADPSSEIGRDMWNALYDKSLTFSSYDFEQFGTGSMITRTLNNVNVVQQGVVWFIQMMLPVPAVCIMGTVMAFSTDTTMGFLLVGTTVFILLLAISVTHKASVIFDKLQKFLDRMNVVLRENITGVRVIRAFNKGKSEERRVRKSFKDYAEAAVSTGRLFVGLESIALPAVNLIIVVILRLGANRTGTEFMEIGDITALTQYAMMILSYIIMAQMVTTLMPRAMICVRRISDVLYLAPEIQDGTASVGNNLSQTKEVIRFKTTSFRFADADENTLENLNFTCRRGETTATTGSTGDGKSTIAKLILRSHDVTSGSALLNGKDIRNMTQKELREHIPYVSQRAWLFSGTIADNLRHGDDRATEQQTKYTLSVAQSEFIYDFPDSLYSHVSQGGTNFSGGQKQRLSITRALAKKADLYILDDSFSALNLETDAALRKALAGEVKDVAVLIIAQRISTVMNVEQIIVLEEGRVAGIGSHDFLMQTCPVYQDIAKSQMKGDVNYE